MSQESKKRRKHRQAFLLSFFNKQPENQHKFINGFVLFKHYNSVSKIWQVDIFTDESWRKMKEAGLKLI